MPVCLLQSKAISCLASVRPTCAPSMGRESVSRHRHGCLLCKRSPHSFFAYFGAAGGILCMQVKMDVLPEMHKGGYDPVCLPHELSDALQARPPLSSAFAAST